MNEEIKELLNNLKSVYELNKPLTEKYKEDCMRFIINTKEAELLLDYITTLQQEIERLNNIINELENTIANFIKNHTESYIDWKYDREIYLAESNVLQKLFDTYLDKLKELKDSD